MLVSQGGKNIHNIIHCSLGRCAVCHPADYSSWKEAEWASAKCSSVFCDRITSLHCCMQLLSAYASPLQLFARARLCSWLSKHRGKRCPLKRLCVCWESVESLSLWRQVNSAGASASAPVR